MWPSTEPDSLESLFIFSFLSARTKLDDRKEWKWLICEIEQFKRQKNGGFREDFKGTTGGTLRVLLKVLPTAKFPYFRAKTRNQGLYLEVIVFPIFMSDCMGGDYPTSVNPLQLKQKLSNLKLSNFLFFPTALSNYTYPSLFFTALIIFEYCSSLCLYLPTAAL